MTFTKANKNGRAMHANPLSTTVGADGLALIVCRPSIAAALERRLAFIIGGPLFLDTGPANLYSPELPLAVAEWWRLL
jgi:hypothetical protein